MFVPNFIVVNLCIVINMIIQNYTDHDGIKSKKNRDLYYFVNFQKNMMGITSSGIKYIRQMLMRNPSYFEDKAREALASNYSSWNSSPAGLPTIGLARASVFIYKYNSQYSTGSKYTYRKLAKDACHSGYVMDTYGSGNYWSDEYWGADCYTFSKDRTVMIIWDIDEPEKRHYYKRIDIEELIPNTDFLY